MIQLTMPFIVFLFLFSFASVIYAGPNNNNSGFAFFDQIYTINLPSSKERKAHVVAEFRKVGVNNLTISPGVDKDSALVKQTLQSDFVFKYPPCFRCNKRSCNCHNNVIIAAQIGNWLAFINVFKDIVKNNYDFVLITEDDVKFTADAVEIFNRLVSLNTFAEYKLNLNKPILICCEDYHVRDKLASIEEIKFNKNIRLSNACFIVNKHFAKSFLANLHRIDTTSDVFIHMQLIGIDKSIQHVAMHPKPSTQLSNNILSATFYSTIHPKGIDEFDKQRQLQHKKHVTYWQYLSKKIFG